MIIGLSGRLGVGKDYIARSIIQPFVETHFSKEKVISLAFADQLKINTIIKHNVPFESVFVKKTRETRELLQREGTEIGRNNYGKDIWIRHMDNWVNVWKSRGFTTFLITDVRFKNEVNWIQSNGGIVIRINAPIRSKMKLISEISNISTTLHQSENELDNFDENEYDFVFNNDSSSENNTFSLKEFIYNQFSNQKVSDDKKNM